MGKACILVKSPNADTYISALSHVVSRVGKLEHLELVFFQSPRLPDVISAISQGSGYAMSIRDVSGAEDLRVLIRKVDVCDVSGLPKEDFAEVLAVAIGRSNVSLCTLTRDA